MVFRVRVRDGFLIPAISPVTPRAPRVEAAVNLVESAFGRVGNTSSAGAQGPMQFLPATWKAYGLGGDIHSPRDAVLGAGNYLHQSGPLSRSRQGPDDWCRPRSG